MFLSKLKIRNFRNIGKIDLNFTNLINYIYSPNGTGKTNVLEAIQCISIGKSLRSQSENDLINFNSDKDSNTIYISGDFKYQDTINFTHSYSIEVLQLAEESLSGRISKKKSLLINKNKTTINNFLGRVPSIWFSPESIRIINSSPQNKRKYFDEILIQLYPEYIYDLRNYNRALKQRNKLLQEEYLKLQQVGVFTEQIIQHGCRIIKYRQKFFNFLNEYFKELTEIERYRFKVDFKPNIQTDEVFEEDVEHTFREALRRTFDRDKARQSTSVGPHRDDWEMLISIIKEPKATNNTFIQADKYASRGQQRMALIMLQMVLVKIFERNLDRKPILLLDDIFSELDETNEKILLKFIQDNNIQSFITGVEKKDFKDIDEINLTELIK